MLCGKTAGKTDTVVEEYMDEQRKEHIILEIAKRAGPTKRKETSWKDDVVTLAKAQAAKAKAQPKAKANSRVEIESEV